MAVYFSKMAATMIGSKFQSDVILTFSDPLRLLVQASESRIPLASARECEECYIFQYLS